MNLVDAKERELATDPKNSYIVQAPAGSGKTEVLSQRYLRLLSNVQHPSEIICITFTKKAANEMRERIINALDDAHNKVTPKSLHKQKTYLYATNALLRAEKNGWNLLEQPSCLKIITIDALCQNLSTAIFNEESKIAFADISTNTQEIYQQTASACLNYAAGDNTYKKDLQNLLEHVDNRQDDLIKLFAELLNSRDTWLEKLYIAKYQDKETFEKAIQIMEKNAIKNFCQCLNQDLEKQILEIIKKLLYLTNNQNSEITKINNLNALNYNSAALLANLLLTSTNKLRKSFDNHVGLKKGICADYEYQHLKLASKNLFAILEEIPNFTETLVQIKNLPHPKYTDQQWQILQSLFNLLPLLVAHLNLYFNQNNQVDFTGVANEALQALGDDLNPTNLALYLDNKIHHILIDEFQDTSITQFQLLKKLVSGWEENDGRTLFIVGDPQQSIYRFRGAEVGLFLKAQSAGINNLKLIALQLSANFRSAATIVNWVNSNFQNIFPRFANISSGAIKYEKSVPINHENVASFINCFEFNSPEHEAIFIVDTINQELQTNPEASIAILARSRKHLNHIIKRLRALNIPYQGVDIDLLAKQSHIRDVHSLTQALLMPGNRLAWLSLLRSPFCGLMLEDMLAIASFAPQKSIFFALLNIEKIANISKDCKIRLQYVFQVLNEALVTRAQTDTITWLKKTLAKLHLEFIVTSKQETDLSQYWELLSQSLQNGQIKDWRLFNEQLNNLYARQSEPANLQIMTIHKSKGLEFDCVIIPGLSTKSSKQDNSLFRNLNILDENDEDIFLFSPIKAAFDEECKLYSYLKKIDEQKSNYELQRLLYVAITRAKTKLYLTDSHNKSITKNTFRSFLKNITFKSISPTESPEMGTNFEPKLYHLPSQYYESNDNLEFRGDLSKELTELLHIPRISKPGSLQTKFAKNSELLRIKGIAFHELLQWICNNHPERLEDIPWNLAKNRLRSFGIIGEEITNNIVNMQQKIQNLYNDAIGRWIISKQHAEKNEYEILVKKRPNKDEYVTKIIDRTFVCDGCLWIIDFKTGNYTGHLSKPDIISSVEYINQVNEYAEALFNSKIPIKCGLYYIENNFWYSWEYNIA